MKIADFINVRKKWFIKKDAYYTAAEKEPGKWGIIFVENDNVEVIWPFVFEDAFYWGKKKFTMFIGYDCLEFGVDENLSPEEHKRKYAKSLAIFLLVSR